MPSLEKSASETDEIDKGLLEAFEFEARQAITEWSALEFASSISEASTKGERNVYLGYLETKPDYFQREVISYLADPFLPIRAFLEQVLSA